MSLLKATRNFGIAVCVLLVIIQGVKAKKVPSAIGRGASSDSPTSETSAVSGASATNSGAVSGDNSTDGGSCVFVPDFSTTEAAIRSNIFLGDEESVANLMGSQELFSVAAGYTYRDNETCLVTRTEGNRAADPDIVSLRALVLYAEKYGDTEYLARGMVLSFELECQCSLFTPQEKDELTRNIQAVLDDPVERETIMNFGLEEQESGGEEVGVAVEEESTTNVIYVQPSGGSVPVGPQVFVPARPRPVVPVRPRPVVPVRSPPGDDSGGFVGADVDTGVGVGGPPFSTDGYRRRLTATESSPTNSFYCAHCEPRRPCRRSGLSWCQ